MKPDDSKRSLSPVEEVHLWRGTQEQQALRAEIQKLGQFSYFDRQLGHPEWRGKTLLDFGGNQGNLLLDAGSRIRPQDYTCVDVLKPAVEAGRKRFPRARWVHYDRFNVSFNPEGVADLPIPDLGTRFSFILAYSVFTHTTRREMHDLVSQLRGLLAPDGVLAFTFIDPHFRSGGKDYPGTNLRWRLEQSLKAKPELDLAGLMQQSAGCRWCALVDGAELYVGRSGAEGRKAGELITYHVFYTVEFLQEEFPDAVIRPPVNGEMQHCCLLRRPGSSSAA